MRRVVFDLRGYGEAMHLAEEGKLYALRAFDALNHVQVGGEARSIGDLLSQ